LTDRFSRRVPQQLAPNRLTRARQLSGPVPFDLTVSNPTRCELPYPRDLLAPLADPAGLDYAAEPRGPSAARQAVAECYRSLGAELDPASVVLTASTSEAYSLLFKLLCDSGDTVLAPTPSYPLFDQLSRLDAVSVLPFGLRPEDDWRPDLQALFAAPARTRAVILVHPNNPTGNHVHPEDAAEIAALCRERNWALIVDEVFLPYVLDGGPGADSTLANGFGCLTFTLGGLSKGIGMPQLKLAWIAVTGPDDEVEPALARLDYIADAYLSVSAPVALAAPRLIPAAASVRRAIVSRCRGNLDTLRAAAASHPAVTVPKMGGGWSAVLRLPAVIDEEEIALRLLSDDGVAVQPGFFFDLPFDAAMVLSLLTPERIWRHGLDSLFDGVERALRSSARK
jgi:aspartate/methionine/tyrosine aminotransferase